MNNFKILFTILIVIIISIIIGDSLSLKAATCTWNGSIDANWSTDGNWDGCSVPVDGDDVVFPFAAGFTSLVNDLPSNQLFNGILIEWEAYTFSGNPINLRGDFTFDDDDNNGDLTFGLDFEVVVDYVNIVVTDSTTTMYLDGIISGAVDPDLYKRGSGGLVLQGASGNTYLGDTIVEEGILRLNKSAGVAVPSSVIIVGDSIGADNSAQIILLNDDQINASANYIVNEDGRLEIGNNNNNILGLDINGGNVDLGNTTISGLVDMSGGRLRATNLITANISSNTINCSELNGENAVIEGDPFNLTATTLTLNSNSSGDIDCEIISVLQGGANIVINGLGILFTGNNTFTGTVTINNNSSLEISHANALGNSSSGTTVNSGGALCLSNGITTALEPLTISGLGNNLKGPLCSSGGTNTYSGPITLTGNDNTYISVIGNSNLTISGVISGSLNADLIFQKFSVGSGVIQLSAANVFTADLIVLADVLVRKTASVNIFPDTINLFLNQYSTVDLNSFSETFGGINGEAGCAITLGNGTATLGANNGNSTTPCLVSGNGGITKVGSGVVTLTANNTYTGTTNITAGQLNVNGQQASSPVSLNSTGILGGNGRVGVITGGGTGAISPGNSPGILNVTGNVAFANSNSFNIEINGPTLGTQYDQLNVLGSVNLNNATLNISLGFTPLSGQSFTIVNATGVLIGTFNGLPNGSTFSVGGNTLRIDYGTSSVVVSVSTGGGNSGTGGSNGNGSGGSLAETGISIPLVALSFVFSVTALTVFINKYYQKRKRLNKNFR